MQRTLHIRLEEIDKNKAQLRYYFENPNDYRQRDLDLSDIAALIDNAESGYYKERPDDFSRTGQKLYHWLDSADRFLDQAIRKAHGTTEILVLAIEAEGKLSHLPWETLHDGISFFVQRKNPMIAPVRWFSQNVSDDEPVNRPLQALFMATSPQDVSLLDFEKEEALILEATQKQPMTLIVEESGELGELQNLLNSYPENYFDVFHLTGHATIAGSIAVFLTESDTGKPIYASAEMLSDSLIRMPRLIFLSGCRTAESAKQGAMLSLAQELIQSGAKAVLGWGRPVWDTDASMAAAELYGALSCGHELSKALAMTYQRLIENNAKDWHLLRLNIAGKMPGALVTPLKTPKREKAKPPSFASTRFLDTQGKVKVVSRENFIGRRRFLQRCIKSLRYDSDKIGVLLFGMGGIGKSSLAARLCDRLNDRQPVVWFGKIDEFALVNRLCEDLNKPLRDVLMNPDEELKFRLRTVFEQHDKPLLLILDDFEANLEMRNGLPVPSVEAKAVIEALSFAILKSEAAHRLIITSRYQFDIRESAYLLHEQLTALDKSDVSKKVSRLEKSKVKDSDEIKKLKQQAIQVADGNPRLLEWLFAILSENGLDYEKILSKMAEKETEFRENILAEELLKQQEPELRKMLALASVYELPVPKEAVEAVCKEIADLEKHLERAAALGLIEETTLKEETLFRVSRILLPVLKGDLPEDMEELSRIATHALDKWFKLGSFSEEQMLEIHRLSLAGKVKEIAAKIAEILATEWYDQSRFREVVSLCNNTLNVIGNDYRVVLCLARAQESLGEIENALKNFQQALQDCPDKDETNKTTAIINMALFIYHNKGQAEEALTMLREAADISERIGDFHGKTYTLHNMAHIYHNHGQTEEALTMFREAADISERIGNVRVRAYTLHEIARIYLSQSKTEEALKLFYESLDLKESIGNVQGKAATIHNIAMIYQNQGKIEEALTMFREAADIGDFRGKAFTLTTMAQLLAYEKGDIENALIYLKESLEIYEKIGSPEAETVKGIMADVIALGKSEPGLNQD